MSTATLEAVETTKAVRAEINYAVPRDRPPVFSSREGVTDLLLSSFEVSIRDASKFAVAPRLDVEGFTVAPHKVDIGDLLEAKDMESQARIYSSQAALMLELTGADEIIVTPSCIIRRQDPQKAGAYGPVDFVHSDFTIEGAPSMSARTYNFATRAKVRRSAMFNMWKLLSEGPTNRPLALCDARSVAPEDIIAGEARHHLTFGTTFVRYNPDHRWAYFSALNSSELLVFKQSDTDPAYPRVVPHTAFKDSSAPPDAKPRISIEVRCLGVWYH